MRQLLSALFSKLDLSDTGKLDVEELRPVSRAFVEHWDADVHQARSIHVYTGG